MNVYSAKNPCQGKSEKEFVATLAKYVRENNGYIDTEDYISFLSQVQIVIGIDLDDFERIMLMWMPAAETVCINLYEEQYDAGYKDRALKFMDAFFDGGIDRNPVPFEEIMNEIKKMKKSTVL